MCQCNCKYENNNGECMIKSSRCYNELVNELYEKINSKDKLESDLSDIDCEIEELENEINSIESLY